MKNTLLVITLICSVVFSSLGQSMYGDAAKADVKMNYVYSLEEALLKANETNKLIFFNCFADWAVPCHSMNKKVFSDQEFSDWMDENFVNFFTDVTKGNGRALAEKYNIKTMAHYLVLDGNGEVVHRIVGGSPIPEFKKQLQNALNPKTSLRGMKERYKNGENKVAFLRDYFETLRLAEENSEAKNVLDEIFTKLKKKDWMKPANWAIFKMKMSDPNDEYASFLLENKGKFEKANGEQEVADAVSKLFEKEYFSMVMGRKQYDTNDLLDCFILMQKFALPSDDNAYVLYDLAKYHKEKNIKEIINILETQHGVWDNNLIRVIDFTLADDKQSLSEDDKTQIASYWEKRFEEFKGSSTASHYKNAIDDLTFVPTTGISFIDGDFSEAKKLAEKENKLVFMDCFTTWCGPCKWLDANTFRDEKVGDYFDEHFVSIKVDMEKGEGVDLREHYEVKAFPTLLILDTKGNVLKKVVGAVDANKLMDAVQSVVEG